APRSCSCCAMIPYGLSMEQDQASKQTRRRQLRRSRRTRRKQNRSLPQTKSKSFHLRFPQNRRLWLGLDFFRLIPRVENIRLCRSRTNQPNACFSGGFPLISSVLRRVTSHLWSVLAVGEYGPFLRAAEFCASSRTTNAKRILPIPDDGGPGEKGKQTGM